MTERLNLTTNSVKNVVISNASDSIYYEVVTPKWDSSVTRVSRKDPTSLELEVIAELQNDVPQKSRVLPTPMRFRAAARFAPSGDLWLRDGVAEKGARFRGKDGKYYQWKRQNGRLELIEEQDPESERVAVFHKCRRQFLVMRMSRQPYLEVQQSALDVLDSLIVSFLLMERKTWFKSA